MVGWLVGRGGRGLAVLHGEGKQNSDCESFQGLPLITLVQSLRVVNTAATLSFSTQNLFVDHQHLLVSLAFSDYPYRARVGLRTWHPVSSVNCQGKVCHLLEIRLQRFSR